MMSVEEELDYMSDAFICTSPDLDIRPGLNRKIRKEKLPETKNDKPVSLKVLEKENREGGLQTPISSNNKGFSMMAKMGFKPGSGLGKSGEGRSEPVPITVKSDREGLGRKLIREEVAALKAKLRRESKKRQPTVDDYRKRIAEEANMRSSKTDLFKSQKICYTLDSKEGIKTPEEEWFWYSLYKENNEEKSDFEEIYDEKDETEDELMDLELSVQDKLHLLTLYLRRTYCYCIWCGTQFDDEKDLQQECPGSTREDH